MVATIDRIPLPRDWLLITDGNGVVTLAGLQGRSTSKTRLKAEFAACTRAQLRMHDGRLGECSPPKQPVRDLGTSGRRTREIAHTFSRASDGDAGLAYRGNISHPADGGTHRRGLLSFISCSFLCLKVGRVPIQSLVRGRALTVFQVGGLSHLDNVTVGIADVAANLAVLGYRLCDELRSATCP